MHSKGRAVARASALVLIAGSAFAAIPAAAHAAGAGSKFWVNGAGSSAGGQGKSCALPGYSSVQAAVSAAEGSGVAKPIVEICSGTYVEQVVFSGSKSVSLVSAGPSVTLELPQSPVADATCGDPNAYIEVSLCAAAPTANVSITGVAIEAQLTELDCATDLYGIFVGGGDKLTFTNSSIDGASEVPLNGCQVGLGILVGLDSASNPQVGHATLTNDHISGYQKDGIVVDGPDSTATITSTVVQGAGESDQIAQNGIEIDDGAVGTINKSTITDNECDLPGVCSDQGSEAYGVLFYYAGAGSKITNSVVSNNDSGIYTVSDANTASRTPEFTLSGDSFANHYINIDLGYGTDAVTSDKVSGSGEEGILVEQWAGDPFGAQVAVNKTTISGQSVAAVDISSDQDPSDQPGTVTISGSTISGNPSGASVVGSILDNSSNFAVTLKKDK